MDIFNTYVLPLKDPIRDAFEAHIIPLIPKDRPLTRYERRSISTAVALLGVYLLFKKITRPPKSLRHLPRASFISLIKGFLEGKSSYDFGRDINLPVVMNSPSGLYVRSSALGTSLHVLRPDTAKQLFQKLDTFEKAALPSSKDSILGRLGTRESMFFLDGSHWKAQRRVANPAFHRSMPTDLFGRLTSVTFIVIDSTMNQEGVTCLDVPNLTKRWTLDTLGLAGFDFNFHAVTDEKNEWVDRYNVISKNMSDPFFMAFPFCDSPHLARLFPKRQKVHQEIAIFRNFVDKIIANKRRVLEESRNSFSSMKESEKDLLTLMLEASEEEGNGSLSDSELRANLLLFFIAGHDTTSNALASAIYHLAVNQDIQKRAREQIIEVLGGGQGDVIPTIAQLRNIPYIDMIIKETLRINPPVGVTAPRSVVKDTEINGVVIPKGTQVFGEIYEIHHNPNVWKEPDTFNPERFAPGGEAEHNGSYAWQPFITGPRQCIGMNFSLAEQRVFLSMLLRKYEWRLPEDSIHKDGLVTKGFIVVSASDLKVVFKRRY